MSEQSHPTLWPPFKEIAVLKENKFKRVTLMSDYKDQSFISKSFQGHRMEHSRANAKYAFDVLAFFSEHFRKAARIPKPLALDVNTNSVYLEFLPELQGAKLLDVNSLHRAQAFFKCCYDIKNDHEIFRSIEDSIYYNPLMESWISQDHPLSLGLKGDLWQNLCASNSGLVIADIDSAAIEPLGFSEIVMHAEIHASLNYSNIKSKISKTIPKPVCFSELNSSESEKLVEIALHFVSSRMSHLSPIFREAKMRIARAALLASISK